MTKFDKCRWGNQQAAPLYIAWLMCSIMIASIAFLALPSLPASAMGLERQASASQSDCDLQKDGFTLINTVTNKDIQRIRNNKVIRLERDMLSRINIRVDVTGTAKSVVIKLDDDRAQTEHAAPYALFGNSGRDYKHGRISVGSHKLTASAHPERNGKGQACDKLTVNFEVKIANSQSNPTATSGPTRRPTARPTRKPMATPVPMGSIGDRVWSDPDNDGNRRLDGDDKPLKDVVVQLLDTSGNILATKMTNRQGRYLFDNLAFGTYVVKIDERSLPSSKQGNPAFDPDRGDDNRSRVTINRSNPDDRDQDFAYFVPEEPMGSIGDRIWSDPDNDGNARLDGDDKPLKGVNVILLDQNGNRRASTTTNANGRYLFSDLAFGTYTIKIDESSLPDPKEGNPAFDPDGGDDNKSKVTLNRRNPNNRDQDFAYFVPAATLGSIGDRIWSDPNNDGNRRLDGDDRPLKGVRVRLLDRNDKEVATKSTNKDGRYLFGDLPLGRYTVVVDQDTLPDDKQRNVAFDPDGGNDGRSAVNLTEDRPNNRNQDFAYFIPVSTLGAIGNRIWSDDDKDGNRRFDGDDKPLANVTVRLFDGEDELVATTKTNRNGFYHFRKLPLGTYTVRVDEGTLPAGKQGNPVFDPDGGNDNQSTVKLDEASPENFNQDFAYAAPRATLGSIGNRIWSDNDNDGNSRLDGDDKPLADVVVRLLNNRGDVVAADTTDDKGFYLFKKLPLGTYTVQVDESTLPGSKQGNVAYDPDGDDDSISIIRITEQRPDNRNQDFAYFIPAPALGSIGDRIWSDNDNDGNRRLDGDDKPLAGVRVKLLDNDGDVVGRKTTDNRGFYIFRDLPFGTYTVMVDENTLPNRKQGNVAFDPDGGDDNMSKTTINRNNPDNRAQDFAYSVARDPEGSINGVVFSAKNQNSNGVLGNNDKALNRVLVTLLNRKGDVLDTDLTNRQGRYHFDKLPLGTYTVIVDESTLPGGKQGNVAFDPDGGDDGVAVVTLRQGNPDKKNLNFAYFVPAEPMGNIGGQVWSDPNNDGNSQLDGDDKALRDVRVHLVNSNGRVIARKDTNRKGFYMFSELPLGTYTIKINKSTLPGPKQANPAFDPDGGDDNQSTVRLTRANSDERHQDFAYFIAQKQTGRIGGAVRSDDQNGNARSDGDDTALRGVVVKLVDNRGETIATDTTDIQGEYLFTDVPHGSYTVMIRQGSFPDGKQGNPIVDPDGGNDNMSTVTLDIDNFEELEQNFAYFMPQESTGVIGDRIWSDDDRDGNARLDGDDEPQEGITVTLLDRNDKVVATDQTNRHGRYLFTDLPFGTYKVVVDESTLASSQRGNIAYDPDGGERNQSVVTISREEPENRRQDFAYFTDMGDVNCDGGRDAIDVLYNLQYDVGLRPGSRFCGTSARAEATLYELSCDVTGDRKCDAVDALLAMQCVVGLYNEICPAPDDQRTSAPENVDQGGGGAIYVGDIPANSSGRVSVPVMLVNAENVGATKIEVEYDNALLEVVSCTRDESLDNGVCNSAFGENVVSFNTLSLEGLSGNVPLFELEFQVKEGALAEDMTPSITIKTAANEAGDPISLTVGEGSVSTVLQDQLKSLFLPLIQK